MDKGIRAALWALSIAFTGTSRLPHQTNRLLVILAGIRWWWSLVTSGAVDTWQRNPLRLLLKEGVPLLRWRRFLVALGVDLPSQRLLSTAKQK